jgi:hypothetical protein
MDLTTSYLGMTLRRRRAACRRHRLWLSLHLPYLKTLKTFGAWKTQVQLRW